MSDETLQMDSESDTIERATTFFVFKKRILMIMNSCDDMQTTCRPLVDQL
ncbi:MAG: hypothetical protein ACKPKO_18140 [Candidatus Fonsibacter sp.]